MSYATHYCPHSYHIGPVSASGYNFHMQTVSCVIISQPFYSVPFYYWLKVLNSLSNEFSGICSLHFLIRLCAGWV